MVGPALFALALGATSTGPGLVAAPGLRALATMLLAAVVLALLWVAANPVRRLRVRHLPGTSGRPFLGDIPEMKSQDVTAFILGAARKYGKVFTIWFGSKPWVVISDPELIRKVGFKLTARPYGEEESVHTLVGEQFDIDAATLLFLRGAPWRTARRAFEASVVHPESLAGHVPAIRRCIDRFLPRLQRYAAATAADGYQEQDGPQPMELCRHLADMTMAAVGEVAYGVDFGTSVDEAASAGTAAGGGGFRAGAKLVAAARQCFDCLDLNNASVYMLLKIMLPGLTPLWRWLAEHVPDAAQRRHMAARQAVADVSRQLIAMWTATANGANGHAAAAASGDGGGAGARGAEAAGGAFAQVGGGVASSSFLAGLLAGREGAKEGERLSDTEVVAQCLIFLLAGFDTTASTIAFTIYLLATHPEAEAKLLAELDAVLPYGRDLLAGGAGGAGADGGGGTEDGGVMPQLPYLEAVLKESMRLYPAAAAALRHPPTDVDLGEGRVIPKDTFVYLATYNVHHDPAVWPHPERFLPERFLPETGGVLGPSHPAGAWVPFGTGSRMCVGNRLATLVSKATLVEFYRRYTFRIHPKQVLPLQTRTTFTFSAKDGVWVTVHPRGEASARQA